MLCQRSRGNLLQQVGAMAQGLAGAEDAILSEQSDFIRSVGEQHLGRVMVIAEPESAQEMGNILEVEAGIPQQCLNAVKARAEESSAEGTDIGMELLGVDPTTKMVGKPGLGLVSGLGIGQQRLLSKDQKIATGERTRVQEVAQ